MSKSVKTRIQHKHDTESNWELATGFKPLEGELIVYEADNTQGPRLKIGDNVSTVDELPFVEAVPTGIYGVCTTAAGTAAKTVTIPHFKLKSGATVIVKFNYTNSATNPTLNVNGTGAYSIIYKGNSIAAYPLFSIESLEATKTYEFVFTGSNYELVGSLGIDRFVDTASNKSGYVKPGGDIYWTNGVGTVPGLSDKPDVYVSETAPQTTKVGSIWFDTSVVSTVQAEEAEF